MSKSSTTSPYLACLAGHTLEEIPVFGRTFGATKTYGTGLLFLIISLSKSISSSLQEESHPSPFLLFPSSQVSVLSILLFPHTAALSI
jgi:hypothetical protein